MRVSYHLRSIVSFLLASICLSKKHHAFFGLPKSHYSSALVQLRGGAGPLDPELLAKYVTGTSLVQGTLATLGPQSTLKHYGTKKEESLQNDVMVWKIRQTGMGILSLGLLGFFLFFVQEGEGSMTNLQQGVQAANIFWAYERIRDLFSGDALRSGYEDTTGLKLNLAIFVFNAYAMTQDYADTVIKIVSVFWGLIGLHMFAFPETGAKLWHYKVKDNITRNFAKEFSLFLMSYALFTGPLVFSDAITKTQALGYATIPWIVFASRVLLTDKYAVDKRMLAFWLLQHLVVVATTLF